MEIDTSFSKPSAYSKQDLSTVAAYEPPLFSAGCKIKSKNSKNDSVKNSNFKAKRKEDGFKMSNLEDNKTTENENLSKKRLKSEKNKLKTPKSSSSKLSSEKEVKQSPKLNINEEVDAEDVYEEIHEKEGKRDEDEEVDDDDDVELTPKPNSTLSIIKLNTIPKTFESLGVNEWLIRTLHALGIKTPTPVQYGCIPPILAGKNVIGMAETGSGKTAAFALPILQQLAHDPYGIFALVLTPTRELANQIADQFTAIGSNLHLRSAVIIGGCDSTTQSQEIAKRPHLVIATPGRLMDHLTSDESTVSVFSRIKFLVLDEADRLLDSCFENEMRVIFQNIPKKRQTLLFSATMTPNIQAVEALSQGDGNFFRFDACEKMKTVKSLDQNYIFVPENVKDVYLYHLLQIMLQEQNIRSCIVFTSTCRSCHYLSLLLTELGIPNTSLHSLKPQRDRSSSLHSFKSSQSSILVATDVASRGLDIPTVDLVINYDVPRFPRDYIHRVGRTARAGRKGRAMSIITQYDVQLIQNIETLIEEKLSEFNLKENLVLKEITKVFKAKKVATLKIFESGFDDLVNKKKEMKKKYRRENEAAADAAAAASENAKSIRKKK